MVRFHLAPRTDEGVHRSSLATEHRREESCTSEQKDGADHEAERSSDARDDDVDLEVAAAPSNPNTPANATAELDESNPTMKQDIAIVEAAMR